MLVGWDDHEILDDWGKQRLIAEGHGELFENGARAFFEYWPVQGPAVEPQRLYRRQRWGPHAELFVLDVRSYRAQHISVSTGTTPQMSTMLGQTQLDWLLAGLADSTATWRFVVTSVPLSYPTGYPRPKETGYDGWVRGGFTGIFN